MRATTDGPATGKHGDMGGCDAVVRHRPRRAGRDPTIPTTRASHDAAPQGTAPYGPALTRAVAATTS